MIFLHIRIPGVLQRIAVVYLISSFLFLKSSIKVQIYFTVFFLVIYWILMTFIPVPGVGPANLEKTTNLAAWLDNLIIEWSLMELYKGLGS